MRTCAIRASGSSRQGFAARSWGGGATRGNESGYRFTTDRPHRVRYMQVPPTQEQSPVLELAKVFPVA